MWGVRTAVNGFGKHWCLAVPCRALLIVSGMQLALQCRMIVELLFNNGGRCCCSCLPAPAVEGRRLPPLAAGAA